MSPRRRCQVEPDVHGWKEAASACGRVASASRVPRALSYYSAEDIDKPGSKVGGETRFLPAR